MKKLIKKEIIINRKYLFLALLFLPMAFAVLYIENVEPYTIFMVHIVLLTCLSVFFNLEAENKAKIDTLFLSLPIDKVDIIKAKYMIYGFLPVIFSILFYLFLIVIDRPEHLQEIRVDLDIIFISTSFALLTLAIILPIIFKWSKTSSIISIILMVIYVLGNGQVINFVPSVLFNSYGWVVLFVVAILVYLASMKISETVVSP